MEFKNPNRLLKLRFLSKHRKAIKEEYLKHAPQTGYVFIRADSYFHAVEKPRFIKRSFNENQFIVLQEQEAGREDTAADEDKWVYYEVHWDSDKTSHHLKEAY
ncbi:hypothetical protein DXT99_17950 [Pontibacter diazotrophicus]|uniref:Uncharacterized protein n=1 Tax=Pontibacter diazotrophicus TaxID=1400979 RepID=A0A3D8L8F0_9BACT|nr:hypothetical protein [Pontibacter diazotrophicus]RDV13658.1 hypothetical protein DXT99_17950 [Pontibacter diazotrophicus]